LGPGHYPDAGIFTAIVTDARGTTRRLRLGNGQFIMGSGVDCPIRDSHKLPAAMDPLPAGVYTVKVSGISDGFVDQNNRVVGTWPAMSAEPITIDVREDANARINAEKRLIARSKSEPFAKYVAETYGIAPIVSRWLEQLLDDNPKVALQSVGDLQYCRRLPLSGDEILKQAAAKHIKPESGKPDKDLLRYISLIARNIHSDAALDASIIIATADVDIYARECAVSDLREFSQKKAEIVLGTLATNKKSPVYWTAIAGLAYRNNPTAIEPLLGVITDKDPARRAFAVKALAAFRDRPVVRTALTIASKDSDAFVRRCAETALAPPP